MTKLEEGAVVGGKYRLERVLGEGGMGAVWAATHELTRMRVAVKFLKPEYSSKKEVAHRFLREARAAAAVRHPNVVSIHDVLQLEDGTAAMVMDYLRGESLGARIARVGPQPADIVARIMLPVVSAVGTAHSLGIVHRDLKPDNLFLSEENEHVSIKVLDFGIAKLTATEGEAAATGALTKTGSVLGTPYYMSPEQAFGERDIDHRSDIWSLGVILWECLTGKRPTEGDNLGQVFKIIATGTIPSPTTIIQEIPADFDSLVMRMLQKERAARPQSLNEVRVVLERFAGEHLPSIPMPVARLSFSSPGTGPGGSAPRIAVVTPAPDNVDPDAKTMSAMNISSVAPPPMKKSSLAPVLAAVLVVAIGGIGTGVYLRQRAIAANTNSAAPSNAIAPSSAPPSVPSEVASAKPDPAVPSASALAVDAPKPKPLRPLASPKPSASATATASAAPSTAPSIGRGPGGLVSGTPF